jgi:hypothetical protein
VLGLGTYRDVAKALCLRKRLKRDGETALTTKNEIAVIWKCCKLPSRMTAASPDRLGETGIRVPAK